MTEIEREKLYAACGLCTKRSVPKLEGGVRWWHPLAIMAVLYLSYRLTMWLLP